MRNERCSDQAVIAANQSIKEKDYWLNRLGGDFARIGFPYEMNAGSAEATDREVKEMAVICGDFPGSLLEKLMKLSGGIDLKLHMILVAGLIALLHRYSRCSDVTIGSPIIKQDIYTEGGAGIEGKFINTILVYRNHILENMSFKELLIQVRATIIQAAENQNFPVHVLPALLNMPETGNEFPLFDVALLLENIHDKSYLYPVEGGYNMSFSFQREENRIRASLEYNSRLYREQTAEQILNHYTHLLEKVLADVDAPLAYIDILSEGERGQLLSEFNGRDEEYPCDKTFHRLFEEQVERTPDCIAVVGSNVETLRATSLQITYCQLNEQSNRLAYLLIEKGALADDIVGIKIDRSIEMIVGVLGILKSGGAYLPIDPKLPNERIDYMLKDSGVKVLVNEKFFGGFRGAILQKSPPVHANLAYVIYTSGSTGKPKGVMVQHNHFVNVAMGWRQEYRLLEMEVTLLQLANFCFDVFAGDLARVLINGGKMIINPEQAASPDSLYRLISTHGVTLLESTPPYIIPFMSYVYENKLEGGMASLQLLILGSDSCPTRDFKELLSRTGTLKRMRIVNSYGVTEATIDSSYYEAATVEDIPAVDTVPIGKPLPNVKFYILDPAGMLLPVGVPGELCIGGASVTRGYLNKPELTAERFNRSYRTHKTYICYKTGDLARWLPGGNVEFLGRMDYQVKVRGFRIELGEIENKLLEHPEIKKVLVTQRVDANDNAFLCGYFVSDKSLEAEDLRSFLGKKLPDYMVPWFYKQLERFPLTANGKIDRKALPDPDISEEAAYAAPRNENERKMIELWADILSVYKERIGIDTRFFDLGGNSLKSIILTTRMHKLFDVKLNMADIFKLQTIRNISQLLIKADTDKFIPLGKAEEKEFYHLPPTQKRFYILQQMDAASTTFNMPLAVRLEGKVEPERVENAFKQLIQRHESLRTSFEVIGNEPVQRVHRQVEFKIEILGDRERGGGVSRGDPAWSPDKGSGSVWASFIRPFDLTRAPLLRVRLIKEAEGIYLLMVDVHHIVSDGTSHHILLNDFRMLYRGEKDRLPELPFQYRDFADWQNYQMSGLMKVHEDFWLKQLEGKIPILHMPTDYPRPRQRSYEGDIVSFSLGKELSRQLQEFIARKGITLYIVLLTTLNILLHRYTGQKDIIIGSPIAGRYHADLENVIGLVLGSVMMRNFPGGEKTFENFLEEVMKNTLQAYEHQAYPFEELLKRVEFVDEPGRDPLTDIALIVQNMGSEEDLKRFFKLSDDLKITPIEPDKGKMSKVDFTISAVPAEDDVVFALEYCTRLFKHETMKRLACHFVNILREGLAHPEVLPEEIDMRTDEEKLRFIGSVEKCHPLSHPQKRIYYTERKYPDTSCNNLAFTIRYGEELDKGVLEESIAAVIRKNEGLRLRMEEFPFDREPVQYIHPFDTFTLDYIDFGSGGISYDQWENSNTRKPFELINSNLFYFAYLRFSDQETGYYMKLHHLICDGWTTLLLFSEIDKIYWERKAGKPVDDTPHPSYLRFAVDEKEYLKSPRAAKDKISWKQILLPLPEEVDLSSLVKMRQIVGDGEYMGHMNIKADVRTLAFPSILREKIAAYGKEYKTSSFKLILAALAIYISRVTGIEDIVIGSANHNRVTPKHKQMVGMFASTIPIRLNALGGKSFSDFVDEAGNTINRIIKNHQRYPFDLLTGEIREEIGSDPGYLLNINLVGHADLGEERFKVRHHFPGYEPTPLAIHINGNNKNIYGVLELEWDYRVERFSAEDIEQIHRGLVNILADALEQPAKNLSEIDLLSREEREQILCQFNNPDAGAVEYPIQTVCELFERQVAAAPDRIAIVGAANSVGHVGPVRHVNLSYRQLNEKANQLAGLLIEKGVLADDIVGLMIDRSIEMIVGIMGILKSSGAYLPIDPQFPQERIDYMLKDSAAKLLFNEKFFRGPGGDFSKKPPGNGNLAYVIYTSGSTGKPKGVAVECRNLMAYINAFLTEFDLHPGDTVVQQASYIFDAFVEEMYPILLRGGELLVPAREEVTDIRLLANIIAKFQVTMITCSPLMLSELNKIGREVIGSIRIFISGGDVLKKEFIDNLLSIGRVYNTYGPTETTVCASYYRCRGGDPSGVPIGRPIDGYRVYIMDWYSNLLPVGVAGELCIEGAGVSRGYLNKPELTAERFNRTYRSYKTYIFYKTGDLARWLPGGNIEFLGRMDHQVNIRGFRVELGEIETHLLKHPKINQAAAAMKETGSDNKHLYAYITSKERLEASRLRDYLSRRLPNYMIPSHFIQVEKMPLLAGGKIDRKSLLALEKSPLKPKEIQVAPATDLEKVIAGAWQEVLKLEEIGALDNFFDLGGDSFNIMHICRKLEEALGKNIPVVKMFKYPTVRSLAEFLQSEGSESGGRDKENVLQEMQENERAREITMGKQRLQQRTRRLQGALNE